MGENYLIWLPKVGKKVFGKVKENFWQLEFFHKEGHLRYGFFQKLGRLQGKKIILVNFRGKRGELNFVIGWGLRYGPNGILHLTGIYSAQFPI